MTDFENASLVVFMALMTRVILTYGLDLTIPISQVEFFRILINEIIH
jgi:hypothetical protein